MTTPTKFLRIRGSSELARVQDNVGKTVDPISRALAKTPLMGGAPVWIAFPLVKAFANIGGAFAVAAYYRDGFNVVRTKGVLVCAAGCGGGAAVGTFPSGYRPKETQRKAVEGNGGNPQAISISPAGVCSVEVAIGAGGSCDFDFTFLAEQ
jgi:hypothetical protein